jgi:methylthioribose-1-phosphate isomerase
MIVDTMVGSLFQHHKIHAVGRLLTLSPDIPALVHELSLPAVGADRIARNGDTANKVRRHAFHALTLGFSMTL